MDNFKDVGLFPITLSDIKEAKRKISNYIVETQLVEADHFSKMTKASIYIKPENMQRVKSFKIRGALNKLFNLTSEQRKMGVIAPSAGNHAQGVALASTLLGVESHIVMPRTAPLLKQHATKVLGGNVILAPGDTFDDACELALKLKEEKGYTFIHAFNDKEVIAGQGTIGLEIMHQLPDVDYIIAPIGGGGLIAGLAVAVKAIKPQVKIIGVEAENFACMKTSVDNSEPTLIAPPAPTIADGTAVKIPGDLTYEITKQLVDEIVVVSEKQIQEAIVHLAGKCKIIAEGAGALSTAAIISGKVKNIEGKNVVLIISGGNIDTDVLISCINMTLRREKKRIAFLFDDTSNENIAKIDSLISKHKAKGYTLEGRLFNAMYKPKMDKLLLYIFTNDEQKYLELVNSFRSEKMAFEVIEK